MNKFILGSALLILCSDAFADNSNKRDDSRASMKSEQAEERKDAVQIMRDATRVYREFTKSAPKPIPSQHLANARCIVVFPEAITAAAIVGGTHGDGVASCKNNGIWSAPTLVDLNAASLGAQLGGKKTDIVLLFNDDKSANLLRQGKFEVGTDASVAMGSYDAAADLSRGAVVAYQRSEGIYVGASLTGGTIASDTEANRSVYGNDSQFGSLIEGKTNPSTVERTFSDGLPS